MAGTDPAPPSTKGKAKRHRKAASFERLQRLVDVLASAPPQWDLANTSLSPLPPVNSPEQPPAGQHVAPPRPSSSIANATRLDHATAASLGDDLVKRLSDLTIKSFHTPSLSEGCTLRHSLVQEARYLLDAADPPALPLSPPTNGPLPSTVFPTCSSTRKLTLQELTGRLPSRQLVDKGVGLFYASIIPYFQYRKHEEAVFSAMASDQVAPAISLAILFTLCALGLLGGELDTPTYAEYHKEHIGSGLIELARQALDLSGFPEVLTLDTIRVLILLGAHYGVLSTGDQGSAGLALLASAANGCLELNLHRDPDKQSPNMSFAEKEDRRRLYHLVKLMDAELATIMGRSYTLLHARNADCRLPLDIADDLLEKGEEVKPTGEESRMTSLLARMRFSELAERITEEVFGVHTPPYSRIIELDAEIRNMEGSVPDEYKGGSSDPLTARRTNMIWLLMLEELLRLHLPYFTKAHLDDQYSFSHKTCIETAVAILQVHGSPLLLSCWSWITFRSTGAAAVLGIELMFNPDCPEAREHRLLIEDAVRRLDMFKAVSTVARRGSALLRFLLGKIDSCSRSFRPDADRAPLAKRIRPSPASPSLEDLSHVVPTAPAEPELGHAKSCRPAPSRSLSLSSTSSSTEHTLSTASVAQSVLRPILPCPSNRVNPFLPLPSLPIPPSPARPDLSLISNDSELPFSELLYPTISQVLSPSETTTVPLFSPLASSTPHFSTPAQFPTPTDADTSAVIDFASFDFAALFGLDETSGADHSGEIFGFGSGWSGLPIEEAAV
ncbi:hypothetical protein JCM11251_003092 [Rhodosporidiobolus azoricus]